MANAPKLPQAPLDGDTDLAYANPVDKTYANPQESYPDETHSDEPAAGAPTSQMAQEKPAAQKQAASKNNQPKEEGYHTAANPVDPSYAPSSYASFSKTLPTAKIANEEKPAARSMNPESSNDQNNENIPRHISPKAHVAPTVSRTVHREALALPATEHQHGLHSSMVAWSAIAAGTLISASISLILLFLASALGLASISPWSNMGASAQAFSIGAAIVLILMQCLSSGLGGYLTGRLRSKWINMMPDEVFFRDTAHGFLSWAIATLLTASVLASAATSAIDTGAAAITTGAAISMSTASSRDGQMQNPQNYFVDKLFRADHVIITDHAARAEASAILATALVNHTLPETDRAYLAQLVSWHTGLGTSDALLRVRDVVVQIDAAEQAVRQNADAARKAASSIALFAFLSLLMGAFVASIGAALGGHHRDRI